MNHLYLKAFHIIGFVSWFGGLFLLVRLFVYHAEADNKPKATRQEWKDQINKWQKRVYNIICNPAMIFTWTFGILMLINNPAFLHESWLHIKLFLLVLLTIYHILCKINIKRLENGEKPFTSFQYRLMNELPTLFLVAIVLLAVVKNLLNFMYLFGGVLAFGVVLYFIAKTYRDYREKK